MLTAKTYAKAFAKSFVYTTATLVAAGLAIDAVKTGADKLQNKLAA